MGFIQTQQEDSASNNTSKTDKKTKQSEPSLALSSNALKKLIFDLHRFKYEAPSVGL